MDDGERKKAKLKTNIKENLFAQFISFIILISFIMIIVFCVTIYSARKLSRDNSVQIYENTLLQLEGKIDEALNSIQNSMSVISYNPTVYSYYKEEENRAMLQNDLVDVLINTLLSDENIQGIELYDTDGVRLVQVGKTAFIAKAPDEVDTIQYSDGLYKEQAGGIQYMVYYPIYDLKNVQYFTKMGLCVFYMSLDNMEKFLEDAVSMPGARLCLLDTQRRMMAGNAAAREEYGVSQTIGTGGEEAYQSERKLSRNGWYIWVCTPVETLYLDATSMTERIEVVYFIVLTLLGLLVFFCYGCIISPLHQLDLFVKRNPAHTNERMEVKNRNEIGTLAMNLNNMLDERDMMAERIQESQKTIYETKLAKKQMEILAYRNQINPHFLYNTLECIRAMASYHECDDVAGLTVALSNVLRYAVKGENLVLIQDEVNYIREYAKIIECRFFGRIRICLYIEESVKEHRIAKLILQPLVENAVFHGLETKLSGGKVDVKISTREDGRLQLSVEDNGCGIGQERLDEIRRSMIYDEIGSENGSQSVGLVNIYQRLKLLYGEEMGMELESRRGRGTRVTITLPAGKEEVKNG